MDEAPPTPPSTLPDELVELVENCSPAELDALVQYAESLANARETSPEETSREVDEAEQQERDAAAADGEHNDRTERPDGVPAKASTTIKEINGNRYYYWQWRDGDQVRSKYKGPVEGNTNS